MRNLRRIIICFLLAVAAMSAVRTLPVFAAQKSTMTAVHHCDCGDHCNLGKTGCDEQGLCAAMCNGLITADFTYMPPDLGTRDSAIGLLAAAHDGITRPPPLGPPRA